MISRRFGYCLIAAALALVPLLTPAVAQADDQLQLSSDDQHWQADLDQPLFNPARRWVPGDAATSTFWIRNTADTSGRLDVAVTLTGGDQLLRQGLRLRARAADHAWTTLPRDGGIQALAADVVAGSTTQVWVTASLPVSADNHAQDRHLDLTIRLTLTQATGTGTPAPAATPSGPLAGTGLDKDALGLAIVGFVTLLAGTVAIRSGRRLERAQGRDDDHV